MPASATEDVLGGDRPQKVSVRHASPSSPPDPDLLALVDSFLILLDDRLLVRNSCTVVSIMRKYLKIELYALYPR